MSQSWAGFNIVTFKLDDTSGSGDAVRVALVLQHPFTLTAGTKPNINRAHCPYTEFQKLGKDPGKTGTLEFWNKNDPTVPGAAPDIAIQKVTIIDVDIARVGQPAGEDALRVAEFELYLADFRQALASPRGGRLRRGLLNPGQDANPTPDIAGDNTDVGGDFSGTGGSFDDSSGDGTDPQSSAATDDVPNSQLIAWCLEAMGMADVAVPDSVDDVKAPRDIKWFGNHATTELQKLLDLTGCVFCPQLDGTATVEAIGAGDDPQIPEDVKLPEITLPGIDRRGQTVVFTSAPSAVISTITITGPSPDSWIFIVQDTDEKWKPLDFHLNLMQSTGYASPVDGVRDNWRQVDEKYRYRITLQAYKFLQLSPDTYNPRNQPILRQVIHEGFQSATLKLRAKVGVQKGGIFVNATDFVEVPITANIQGGPGNVIACAYPLGKVALGGTDLLKNWAELEDGDLEVEVSLEKHDDQGKPVYFVAGFTRDVGSGGVTPLDDDSAMNAAYPSVDGTGKTAAPAADVIVLERPDWRLLEIAEQPVNLDELKAAAKAEADKLLAKSGVPTRILRARGFVAAGTSGLASEVSFDQHGAVTQWKLNNWWRPLSGTGMVDASNAPTQAPGEAYPQATRVEAKRAALGAAGSTMPSVPVTPDASQTGTQVTFPASTRRVVWQQIDDAGTWGADFVRFHQVIPGGG